MQVVVCRLFLVQRLLQKPRRIAVTEFLRPRDQRAIASDLVVLDCLAGSDDRSIVVLEHLERSISDAQGLVEHYADGMADLTERQQGLRVREQPPGALL